MTNPIPSVAPLVPGLIGAQHRPAPQEDAFASVLKDAITEVENYRRSADQETGRFLSGEPVEVHQVALAVQRSELALELFLQAKNKVVQAYQEITRMQL
jgi:flagellar hook-basal body complex protein FliE